MPLNLVKKLLKYCVVMLPTLLLGCDGGQAVDGNSHASISLTIPSVNRGVRALNFDEVTVAVTINDGIPMQAQRANTGDWRLVGLPREDYLGDNSIFIVWSENISNTRLLLAEYNGTFSMTDAGAITPVGSYTIDGPSRFDADGDGVSNLAELSATPATNPLPEGGVVLPEMVRLAASCFDMGSAPLELERSPDEGPQLNVCINEFRMGKYEVTFEEYDAFAEATNRSLPNDRDWGRGKQPVINVSWNDATAYAAWLSTETGQSYRLPTEAEWEYAARAGSSTAFYTGETITTDQANFDGRFTYNGSPAGPYRQLTVSVGAFPANQFGLHDMAGNVREWTCSAYKTPYDTAAQTCDASSNVQRVLRGGSWFVGAVGVRSAVRNFDDPDDNVSFYTGFRLAQD